MNRICALVIAVLLAVTPALAYAQPDTSDRSCDSRDQGDQRWDDVCSPFLWIVGGLVLVGATVGIVIATSGGNHHHHAQPVSP
jgi:hypothetical protein